MLPAPGALASPQSFARSKSLDKIQLMLRTISSLVLAITLLIGSAPAAAQYQTRTWLDWRTLETPRFVFHFPRELERWAIGVAGRMEGVDSSVSRAVGFQP